jgi:DNA polymerase III epsilon subunit-like protein
LGHGVRRAGSGDNRLDPLNDRIVEAAAVIFRGSEVIDTFETLVNPGVRITSALTAIHGITNSMVKGAPAPAEAVSTLAGFVGERPLVIQNAPFDMGFIDTIRRKAFPDHWTTIFSTPAALPR